MRLLEKEKVVYRRDKLSPRKKTMIFCIWMIVSCVAVLAKSVTLSGWHPVSAISFTFAFGICVGVRIARSFEWRSAHDPADAI